MIIDYGTTFTKGSERLERVEAQRLPVVRRRRVNGTTPAGELSKLVAPNEQGGWTKIQYNVLM